MQDRPNFYFEWQTLLNKVYDIKQSWLSDKSLSPETRLERELKLESIVIAGLKAIAESLDGGVKWT